MMQLFISLLRGLVAATETEYMSVVTMNGHTAIVCSPLSEQGINGRNIKKLLREIGLTKYFFEAMPAEKIEVVWTNSKGEYSLTLDHPLEIAQAAFNKLNNSKYRERLFTITFTKLEWDGFGNKELLPFLVGAPVSYNGDHLSIKNLQPAWEWRVGETSGILYLTGAVKSPAIIQDGELKYLTPRKRFPVLILVNEGSIDDPWDVLEKITSQVREQAFRSRIVSADEALGGSIWATPDLPQSWTVDELKNSVVDRRLKSAFENGTSDLAKIATALALGLGTRLKVSWGGRTGDSAFSLSPARFYREPIAIKGFHSLTASLLPDNIPIVGDDELPVGGKSFAPELIGVDKIKDDEFQGLIVDDIRIGDLSIPFLCSLHDDDVIICDDELCLDAPFVAIARQGRSNRRIFHDLSHDPNLLRAIIVTCDLYYTDDHDVSLMDAVLDHVSFDIDSELAASTIMANFVELPYQDEAFARRYAKMFDELANHRRFVGMIERMTHKPTQDALEAALDVFNAARRELNEAFRVELEVEK